MGAPKGSHNARRYHEAQTGAVRRAIDIALLALSQAGVVHRNVTSLAVDVAGRTGQTAGNLRRNITYRALLAAHLSRQRGTAPVASKHDHDVQVLKAELLCAQLDASNARRERERLQLRLALHTSGTNPSGKLDDTKHEGSVAQIDYRRAFESTAHALKLVMDATEVIVLDRETGCIVDKSARPGRQQVVGRNHAKYILEWLADRDANPGSGA